VEVWRVDPADQAALAEWHAVLSASDEELWPGLGGYTRRDVTALARFEGSTRRFELLAAGPEPSGPMLGVGLMELPERDNRHAAEITVAVHPEHRRRGVATAIVEGMGAMAADDGRRALNGIVDVPVAVAASHASRHFAPRLGFEATMAGNSRHLHLPADRVRLDELRRVVATARDAGDYRTVTFEAPWPVELVDDQCELLRVMSRDEPAGDGEREEEVWDAGRVAEHEALRAARGTPKLVAVAEHLPTRRLVAASELLLTPGVPHRACQLETVVHPEHRGHRLGLAVKLANLDFLARRAPEVRVVTTGNAAVNAPMIAINDLLGFEVAGVGSFWQKRLRP